MQCNYNAHQAKPPTVSITMHIKLNNGLLAELQFISLTFSRLFFHSEFKIKINHWRYSSFSLEWWRTSSLMQTHADVVTNLWRRRHDGSGCFFQARVYCNDTRHWLTVEPRQTWPGRLSVSWEETRRGDWGGGRQFSHHSPRRWRQAPILATAAPPCPSAVFLVDSITTAIHFS